MQNSKKKEPSPEPFYDFVIIGAGPTGLTLAWFLQKLSPLVKILLVEREQDIGGCHRVRRIEPNNFFTEHGPRIYIDNYVTFQALLKDMFPDQPKFHFESMFKRYKFSQTDILKYLNQFKLTELLKLSITFTYFIISNPNKHQSTFSYFENTTLKEYLDSKGFSSETQEYINRLCLLTDGGGIDRYTLYEFLEILNQNALYNIYQPTKSNDLFLWKAIKKRLTANPNVTLLLNTNVTQILDDVTGIQTKNNLNQIQCHYARKIIAAIPPAALLPILVNSNSLVQNAFGNYKQLKQWIKYTEYETYIPIMFYFPKTNLETKWGVPSSDWGIASIILSDYLEDLKRLGTVISTCISLPDRFSQYTGKTANQTIDRQELINETFRQLKEIYSQSDLPDPTNVIVSSGVYYDPMTQKYKTKDTAHFHTVLGAMPKSKIPNFHSVGVQNEKSNYAFTSLEAAVENAVYFLRNHYPKTVESFRPKKLWTLRQLIFISIIVLVLFFVLALILGVCCRSQISKLLQLLIQSSKQSDIP